MMDRIHGAYDSNATGEINVKDYFAAFGKLLTPVEYGNLNEIFFNDKQLNLLKETCSIDRLNFDDEPEVSKSEKDSAEKAMKIPETTKLETLLKLREKYKNVQSKIEYLKYQCELPITHEKSSRIQSSLSPGEDILIYVRVYQPAKYRPGVKHKINIASVIVMLGHQTLEKLRDKINCVSDLTIAHEVSENPRGIKKAHTNRDIYKSGFFYIGGTFYNDMRDELNSDNSAVIRTWGKARNLGPFEIAEMEGTRLDSLSLKFGYPWVYQHQGTCEHLIVFSDARLVNPDDDLDLSHYPKIDRVRALRSSVCMLCNIRQVHWIVMDSDRMPHDPCFFCEQCFIAFNYADGKKLGTFTAYRYPYDPLIVKSCNQERLNMEEDHDL